MGSGVRDLEHRNGAPRSKPRRRFGDFAAAGKVTRRPQAAKYPGTMSPAPSALVLQEFLV